MHYTFLALQTGGHVQSSCSHRCSCRGAKALCNKHANRVGLASESELQLRSMQGKLALVGRPSLVCEQSPVLKSS